MTKKNQNPEDIHLFRSTVGQVKKISSDKVTLRPNQKPKPFPRKQPAQAENQFSKTLDNGIERLNQEDSMGFLVSGLQKNVLKKLRKGYYGCDASIDLHGMKSQEAKQHLSRFLQHCIEEGFRCIHIIHGKGYRSLNNQPVLKNDLNIWLRQHVNVLAFCSANPKQGGTGAVLVLLKLSDKYSEEDNTQY